MTKEEGRKRLGETAALANYARGKLKGGIVIPINGGPVYCKFEIGGTPEESRKQRKETADGE